MKKYLFGSKKNIYKGNLHCHSNLSDGNLSPQELKDYYKSNGYSILAITDHEHINNNSYLDDEDFLTITSCEIAIKEFLQFSTMKNYIYFLCILFSLLTLQWISIEQIWQQKKPITNVISFSLIYSTNVQTEILQTKIFLCHFTLSILSYQIQKAYLNLNLQ